MILIKEVLSPLWSSLLSIIIVIIIISNHGIVRGGGDQFFQHGTISFSGRIMSALYSGTVLRGMLGVSPHKNTHIYVGAKAPAGKTDAWGDCKGFALHILEGERSLQERRAQRHGGSGPALPARELFVALSRRALVATYTCTPSMLVSRQIQFTRSIPL